MLAVETKSSKLVSHVWKKRYCDKQIFAAFFSRTIMSQKAGKLSKAVPKLSTGAKNVAILKEVGDVSHQLALIKPLKADTKCSPVKQATCQSAKASPSISKDANETKKTFTVNKPQNISSAQSSTGFPVSPQTEPSSPVASYNPVRLPKLDDDDYDKRSLHELLDNTVESVPLVSGAIPVQLITEQGITLENRETVGVLTLINLRQARMTTMKVFHCSGGYLCVNTDYRNLKEAGLQPMAGVCRGEQDIQGMMVANTSSELTLRLAIFNEKLAKLLSSIGYFSPHLVSGDHSDVYQIPAGEEEVLPKSTEQSEETIVPKPLPQCLIPPIPPGCTWAKKAHFSKKKGKSI